jgi:hypothetical protein
LPASALTSAGKIGTPGRGSAAPRHQAGKLSDLHRKFAVRIKTDMAANWQIIQRVRIALQIALILLLLEILAWLVSIGSR